MARQLAFDLPVRNALGREDFFVSKANALALTALENWRAWPDGKLILVGPAGAGKTHLVHVWATQTGARIIAAHALAQADICALATGPVAVEDVMEICADSAVETALFHLHNLMRAQGQPLLLTAPSPPARWACTLPDLASRMQATPTATLAPPDDALLAAVLVKLFHDRQLSVSPQLVSYLAARIERSLCAAQQVVARLDAAALVQNRAITLPLAAQVLDESARECAESQPESQPETSPCQNDGIS